jgi:ribosomal protein L22
MTSLWNRIKSAKPTVSSDLKPLEMGKEQKKDKEKVEIITPWTISSNLSVKREPLNQFWIRTTLFRVSSQKLNLIGRQITRLPLPMAIAQMKFSPKKAAKEVHQLLLQAQARISHLPSKLEDDSIVQINDPSKFIVQQALVGKGPYLKRIDIKGRGRHGVIWRPHSFLRLQVAIPDEDAALRKKFKVRIHKENKPVMTRLNY